MIPRRLWLVALVLGAVAWFAAVVAPALTGRRRAAQAEIDPAATLPAT